MKRAIKAILLLLWMALIFGLSGQPAELSDELSEISTGSIAGLLSLILRNVDVETIASFLMEYIAYIRKAAHVFTHLIPVDLRQHQIEEHDIVIVCSYLKTELGKWGAKVKRGVDPR